MVILFYPEPLKEQPMAKAGRALSRHPEITWHNDPTRPHDVHIFWSYTKNSIVPDEITLKSKNVINRGCWDISKKKVHRIYNDISINPKHHKGACVEKIDQQAMNEHHKLIVCPTEPKTGYVYEKYFENVEYGYYVKYRVSYADGITHVIKRYNSYPFIDDILKFEVIDKRIIFSEQQEKELIEKSKLFGLNFGEFDVVMDGDIPIVVDVNNIPGAVIPPIFGTPISDEIEESFIAYLYEWIKCTR